MHIHITKTKRVYWKNLQTLGPAEELAPIIMYHDELVTCLKHNIKPTEDILIDFNAPFYYLYDKEDDCIYPLDYRMGTACRKTTITVDYTEAFRHLTIKSTKPRRKLAQSVINPYA